MQFQMLHKELANSAEMIRSLLAGITQAEAQIKPDPDSWSILEVVCHLHDEEVEDFREHLGFILHRQQEEWHRIDPQGWVKERNYNGQDFRAMQDKFFGERKKSLEWLGALPNANWDIEYKSEYGTMTAREMFASWVAHDNLHIRQLVELRRRRIENITRPHAISYAGEW